MKKNHKSELEKISDAQFYSCPSKHQHLMVDLFLSLKKFNYEFSDEYDISIETARDLLKKLYLLAEVIPYEIVKANAN
jgi:hypothetical protein